MALETNNPAPTAPKKGPQPKDTDAALPKDHETTKGDTYGTTEGVKPGDTQFEQVEVPKKQATNVEDPKPGDVDSSDKKAADKSRAGDHKSGKK